jgi:hypothetical protein
MASRKIEDPGMISGAVERTAPSIAPVPMIRHNAEQAWMMGEKKRSWTNQQAAAVSCKT